MSGGDGTPSLPDAELADRGWERVESRSETVADLGPVEVSIATAVYEDGSLRERVRAAAGVDRTWRFFVAGRVDVPGPSGAPALRRLVTDRAASGFADRLADRGFEDVREAERRRLRVGDAEARAVRYEATCRVEGFVLAVEGWVAVWPGDDGFRLAGGAYPRSVREGPADALGDLFEPERFRAELFELIRTVG
ncbi:MAG: hypothetical protein ABEH47_05935 [Haloferacaceae archaeon]